MPSGPRQVLEHRITELSSELEALFESACDNARREQAEQLNQAVRRLRIAPDAGELCATLGDAAARLASGAILFHVADGSAASERINVPLSEAPALAAAAASQDPVIAAATATEVSAALVELLGHAPDTGFRFFPVSSNGETGCRAGLLLGHRADGGFGTAGAGCIRRMERDSRTGAATGQYRPGAGTAAQPATGDDAKPAAAWEDLMAADQQIHLRAQRFARVQAAEMRLYHADVVQVGRSRRNLYEALRQPIDDARQSFRSEFFAKCPSMVDYLHLELTRTLANDDPDLFGSTYPGPLV